MSTFYLDFEGGNDSNDGTSFANRWKTFNAGATAARVAPGDTIRIMASPDATALGQNATWTKASTTLTLTTAVTANIELCESAWTAAANVTTGSNGSCPQGSGNASATFAGAFTTGKAMYKALAGATDFSAYEQVSFWVYVQATLAASTLSLRLCSDTTGDVTVDTLAIPAISATNQWIAVTVNKGSALGASIQSVALYADLDPGTLPLFFDNIIACKAASSNDSLTLKSLIGKVHTQAWIASTDYGVGDIRRPTESNRTGFAYKVTATSGSPQRSAAIEPTWPVDIGLTVVDGDLTWTAFSLEEYWSPILSINGTTVKLNRNLGSSAPQTSVRGYAGATETVAAYKRESLDLDILGIAVSQAVQEAGTEALPSTYVGGYDRTNMSTRSGQTWLTRATVASYSSSSYAILCSVAFIVIDGLCSQNQKFFTSSPVKWKNCHVAGGDSGWSPGTNTPGVEWRNCGLVSGWNGSAISGALGIATGLLYCFTANSIIGSGLDFQTTNCGFRLVNVDAKQNSSYGIDVSNHGQDLWMYRVNTEGNTGGGIGLESWQKAVRAFKCNFADSTPIAVQIIMTPGGGMYSQDDGGVSGTHVITKDVGTIRSATDQRHTASGIAWKFNAASATYVSELHSPIELNVAKVACVASTLVTVTIWVRRDATNIKGRLTLKPGTIAGAAAAGAYTDCNPSVNTWTQYTLTFTPTEACVADLWFQTWVSVDGSANVWIDDIAISQA